MEKPQILDYCRVYLSDGQLRVSQLRQWVLDHTRPVGPLLRTGTRVKRWEDRGAVPLCWHASPRQEEPHGDPGSGIMRTTSMGLYYVTTEIAMIPRL